MHRHSFIAISGVILGIIITAPALFGLPVPAQDMPGVEAKHEQGPMSPSLDLIDVDFPGGTLAAYIEALQKAGASANFVLQPPAAEVVLPEIELDGVTARNAVTLLDDLVGTHARGTAYLDVSDVDRVVQRELETFIIKAVVGGSDSKPDPNTLNATIETRVWSIADLLNDELKAEEVLSAIEAGLELVKNESAPVQLRYHGGSGLVIASGQSGQIGLIHEVIHNLWEARREQREREQVAERWEEAFREREQVIQHLEAQVVSLREERDVLKDMHRHSESESHRFRLEAENASSRLHDCMNELQELKAERRGAQP